MEILVTNDDGINAKGIRTLISIAKEFGNVTVVAPDSPQSAKSHSITTEIPVTFKLIENTENYQEYSCSGTPVDCIKIALHRILKRYPDLILSGINHGTNTSISVIYSGTMAAAIEGAMNGINSIGFSVNNIKHSKDFAETVPFIRQIISKSLQEKFEKKICFNVNFPDTDEFEIKGLKVCRTANGTWNEDFVNANNKYKNAFWLQGEFSNFEPDATDTDEFAVNNGYASIVPVKFEFNDFQVIEILKSKGYEF